MAKANHVVTGKARFSYAHLFQPFESKNGGEPKYSLTLLIPKTDTPTKAAIDTAIAAAVSEGSVKLWRGVVPPNITTTLYDGDGPKANGDPHGPECAGHWVLKANSVNRPTIWNDQNQPVIDPTEVYSGCYGRAGVDFVAYEFSGKRGIGCYLSNVQKLADGESLGGGVSAAEDFGAPAPQPVHQQPAQPAYQQPVQQPAGWYPQAEQQPAQPAYQQPAQPAQPVYQQPAQQPVQQPVQAEAVYPYPPTSYTGG